MKNALASWAVPPMALINIQFRKRKCSYLWPEFNIFLGYDPIVGSPILDMFLLAYPLLLITQHSILCCIPWSISPPNPRNFINKYLIPLLSYVNVSLAFTDHCPSLRTGERYSHILFLSFLSYPHEPVLIHLFFLQGRVYLELHSHELD